MLSVTIAVCAMISVTIAVCTMMSVTIAVCIYRPKVIVDKNYPVWAE